MIRDWRLERDAALVDLEREKKPEVRAEIAETLCQLATDVSQDELNEFSPVVVRLLGDRQPELRCGGLALGAQILPLDEARLLLSRHLADETERIRVEAAGRLADLAIPEARGALAQALTDESFSVRFEAARGMAALKHKAGLETLVEALDEVGLRFRALAILGELAEPEALPHVRRIFDKWLLPGFERTQAAGTLAMLGDTTGIEHLLKRARKRWSPDRALSLGLLGRVKADGAREVLTRALTEPKDTCRGAAARALGLFGGPGVLEVLVKTLEEPGLDDDVRLDLAEGLCHLGSPEALAQAARVKVESEDARNELQAMLRDREAA